MRQAIESALTGWLPEHLEIKRYDRRFYKNRSMSDLFIALILKANGRGLGYGTISKRVRR